MTTAIYIRVSTDRQDPQRQRNEIEAYLGDGFVNAREYADIAKSGADDSREQFQALWDDIEAGEIDRVVAWEISRLSRRLSTAAEFIDLCAEEDVALETLNDMFPDLRGTSSKMDEMIAKFVSWMMEFEREMTRERIRSGVENAVNQGKWVGRPPFGFDIEDGYLEVDPDPFIRMQLALEEAVLQEGHGIAGIADEYNVPSTTLRNIYQNDEKRRLYLHREADDDRLEEAVDDAGAQTKLAEIEQRLEDLE